MCKICNKPCHAAIQPSRAVIFGLLNDLRLIPKDLYDDVWLYVYGNFNPFYEAIYEN